MDEEKLLPVGEEGIEVTALPVLQSYATASKPLSKQDTPVTPPGVAPGTPSAKAQSWGTVISIIVIVLMVVIGAFYAWGKRIAQENALSTPISTQ
ncbi:DUF3149 domain-containing protein [Candidatus Kaiserbacteria bacterium]|nr:DUF3149 domain-containing protein [Candidatus Kaiserbacteria bacterium]